MAVELVVNWLWQGAIVALAAAAMLRVIPTSRTQARYGFLWAACLLVVTLPLAPLVVAAVAGPPPGAPLMSVPLAWWTSPVLILAAWMSWCAFHGVRIATALVSLRTARIRCAPCPPAVQRRLPHWSRLKRSGRRTRLVLSSRVRSAAVLGGGSPLIAITPALIDRLDPADLDRVIVHEWAHVQRHDDRAQVVQLVVHAIAGWHPAVWWLERHLALEREIACDEIAIAITGSTKAYATCLTTLAALPAARSPLMAAPAAVSAAGLRKRLVRLLSCQAAQRPWRAIAICASLALAAVALPAATVSIVDTAAVAMNVLPARPGFVRAIEEFDTVGVAAPLPPTLPANVSRRSTPSREAAVGAPQVRTLPVIATSAVPLPVHAAPGVRVGLAGTPVAREDTAPPPASYAGDDRNPAGAGAGAPWSAAADAGVAIARGSRQAGIAAAGFFNRFGKRMANSF